MLVVVLVLFAGSTLLAVSKGFSFIPDMDSTQMTMTMVMPEEAETLEETAELSDEVIEKVLEIDDIKTVGAIVGGSTMSMLGLGSDDSYDSVSYYIEWVFINHVGRHGARYPASATNCLTLDRKSVV